jgi:hypothetical protein
VNFLNTKGELSGRDEGMALESDKRLDELERTAADKGLRKSMRNQGRSNPIGAGGTGPSVEPPHRRLDRLIKRETTA